MLKPLAAFAAFALAAGGARADIVIQDLIFPNYEPSYVSIFAAGGGETVIAGATRDGAGAAEIAAALRLPARWNPRGVRAATEAQTGPHLALVFAPESGATPSKACAGEARGGVAGGGDLRVLGAFCSSRGVPVSEAVLVLAGSPVPSDPDFGRRIGRLLTKLLPPTNPDFGEGCIGPGC